jgi:hypothetical protein
VGDEAKEKEIVSKLKINRILFIAPSSLHGNIN